ncbi:MAG: DUF4037 domain-containing protein [Thermomicrobia bacterium]|nr:DUF4037 domain-containing protein [Thermomicrobia bacterium]MCA1725383.1 DUF4037 domain-containing protein [Thermomicrobia bacterium]
MPDFIPGLQLSEAFYREAVKPILDAAFPGLVYAAALLGSGSDVLGYDTPRSTDHGWGPRCWLFLPAADDEMYRAAIDETLRKQLPDTLRGYPTRFSRGADSVLLPECPVQHDVLIASLPRFFMQHLGFDPIAEITTVNWLICPQQALIEVTRGAVFHDGFGMLTVARQRLACYPDEIWRTLLAAQWQRISQEEAFVGRGGEVGDELGSAVVAARLVREIMRLCFLMERQYAPYSKWLGTAFAHLTCGPALVPVLRDALHAATWQEREQSLTVAYETVASMHNALGITAPLDPRTGHYHGRPFKDNDGRPFTVIHAERFADAIRATIVDEMLRDVASFIGGIDQFVDSTDVTTYPDRIARLRSLFTDTVSPSHAE